MRSDLTCDTIADMTYRVYVRWPGGRVTDRTTTESRPVADLAFGLLRERAELATEGALGIAYSEDGRQLDYVAFVDERGSEPRKSK